MRVRQLARGVTVCLLAAGLAGCNPISTTYNMATFAYMAKAEDELDRREYHQKYEEACLWPRFNAIQLARESESAGNRLNAAHYYRIAELKGHVAASHDFQRIYRTLSGKDRDKLYHHLAKHKPANIEKCWHVSPRAYAPVPDGHYAQ